MNIRDEVWTGGEHYLIAYRNGTHVILIETPYDELEDEIVFTGHYEKCLAELERIVESNADYDLNL